MLNLQEFRLSAIPDRLTAANIAWIDGDAAVEILAGEAIAQAQKVSSYITSPGARIRDRYQFASDGGWVAYGCSIDGSQGSVPYFKGVNPRKLSEVRGFGTALKIKTVKYETPAKCPALPILPWVDDVTAQAIYNRHGFAPQASETFWQAVQRANAPIAIVEGFKKALSLLAHGMPAIAIRGVTQWREKGTDNLHADLAQFATVGREIYVVFDQDDKAKTRAAVRGQASKLGKALEKVGTVPRFLQWDISLGKGVDDVLYSHGDNARVWLDVAIASALTLKQYKRQGLTEGALAFIHGMLKRDIPIERCTKGKYLPELPEPRQGALHVIDAPMNSGKTYRLAEDYSRHFREQGCFVIVLSPINSLGKQTADSFSYPHIHDRKATAAGDLNIWQDAKNFGGIVMCPDSLHRLPNWVLEHPKLVVLLDEADQVCSHLIEGNTLGDRWSEILGIFAYILKRAAETGCIVAAEAGILDATINLLSRLSGSNDIRIFQHFKDAQSWATTLFHGHISSISGYRARFLQSAGRSRLLYVSSSQAECRRMERALARRYPALKVVRIDSDTNQQGEFTPFFRNPDKWLQDEQPDILILSPSAKSGVSIEGDVSAEDAYFAAVWGYFPCLDTRTHMQQLGRYRPPVPRLIYCPDFIQASGDRSLFSPNQIQARLQKNAEAMAIAVGLDNDEDVRSDEERAIAQLIESEAIGYYAQNAALQGAMMRCALACLQDRLEASGHDVTLHDISFEKCKATAELWKEIKESLWREDADYSAALQLEAEHTPEWARDIKRKQDATLDDRKIAEKVLLCDEFPGMDWNNSDNWYECIYAHDGDMVRGVRLQAQVENLDATKMGDRAYLEKLSSANIKALHHLPKRAIKALVLSHTGVMALLDGSTYSNTDARAIAIKRTALQYAKEIEYWLGLNIKPDQTPIEVCHKLLKKLGLEKQTKTRDGAVKEASRPGPRNEKRDRLYQVDLAYSSYRVQLLKAAHIKLSESVSTISKVDNEVLENRGHREKSPPLLPHLRHYLSAEVRQFVEAALAAAQDAAERLAIWRELPVAVRRSLSVVAPNLCPMEVAV